MDRRVMMMAMGALAMAGGTTPVQAQAPVEAFDTEGSIGGQTYSGIAAVQQTGNTFAIMWRTGNEEFRGVGILRNRVLMCGFQGPNNSAGVAFYEAGANGVWEGEWALIGGAEVGRERWTPRGGGQGSK
jgi:hypothetical protein